VLTRFAFRVGAGSLTGIPAAGGPMSPRERRVAAVAASAACGWMLQPLIGEALPDLALSDAGIATAASIALFVVPDGSGGRLLSWESAARIRWDVLILFGGGLALAAAISETGLAAWIGTAAGALAGLPVVLLVTMTALVIVYLGELASNTAMAAIFLPVAGAAATGLGHDPAAFTLPVALAASIGFMLPVATPPNAIVFTHGSVTGARMLRAGAPLDLIGVAVAVAAGMVLGPAIL
jgi:sodium-dependent dicarboxylate transporter 2/3/5